MPIPARHAFGVARLWRQRQQLLEHSELLRRQGCRAEAKGCETQASHGKSAAAKMVELKLDSPSPSRLGPKQCQEIPPPLLQKNVHDLVDTLLRLRLLHLGVTGPVCWLAGRNCGGPIELPAPCTRAACVVSARSFGSLPFFYRLQQVQVSESASLISPGLAARQTRPSLVDPQVPLVFSGWLDSSASLRAVPP